MNRPGDCSWLTPVNPHENLWKLEIKPRLKEMYKKTKSPIGSDMEEETRCMRSRNKVYKCTCYAE